MPATSVAANTVAVVHVSGPDARIDGQPCRVTSAAYEGDRLSTGAVSKATITSPGTVISVSENTSVQMGAKSLELIIGSVVVSSDAGSLTLTGLGDANFKKMDFKGGAGSFTLDFSICFSLGFA